MNDETASAEDLLRAALRKLQEEEDALKREYDVRIGTLRHRILAVRSALGEQGDADTGAAEPGGPRLPAIMPPVSLTRYGETRLPPVRWNRLLSGLGQTDALIRIARENDGILRVTEAKRILIEAGKVRGQHKNVGGHIYHLVHASEQFEKVEPGVFRLLGSTPCAPIQAATPTQSELPQNTGSMPSS